MRKFFVVEEKVCEVCKGAATIQNEPFEKAIERHSDRIPSFSFKALEEIYGPQELMCPNNCELGFVYERVPLEEAFYEVSGRPKV